MSDRTVKVTLKAEVAEFKRALGEASKAAADVGKKAEATAKSSTTALGQMVTSADKHGAAWTQVGTATLGAGVAIAAGIGLAVSKFADFDKAMSQAQAGTMATGGALASLRAAAIEGGAKTQFSATEAANAITEMGKAGVSTKDILGGGLTGALSLAAAGQISVGRAGEVAATAMNQFNLKGKDLPHVADLMAAAAGKAMGSVDDMANALKFVGPVAKNLNVSIEETTGVIAELASQGIIGEQAGTSMRGMLLSLTSPSKIAATTMADLGLNMYDANGKFVGLAGAAEQLQAKMGTLSDADRNAAMGRIFGNEQITAATILYQGGSKAVKEWTDKVNDSGFAARQAAMLTDNLSGDMERLGGSLDTALIQTGSGANDVLRSMAQAAESAVNHIGAMSPEALKLGLGLGTVTAAAGILGGGFLVLAPRIVETRKALDVLTTSMPKTTAAMKGIGKAGGAAAIAAIAFGALTAAVEKFAPSKGVSSIEETTSALLAMKDAADLNNVFKVGIGVDNVNGLEEAIKRITDPSLMNRVQDFGGSVRGMFPGAGGDTARTKAIEQFKAIGESLGNLVTGGNATEAAAQFDMLSKAWITGGGTIEDLKKMMPGYTDALAGADNAQVLAGKSASSLAAGVAAVDPATQAAADALAKWQQAVSDADASFVNIQGAYDAVIQKNKDMATATADSTKSADDSWQTYYDGVTVTAADYIANLQTQVDAQTNWETNMLTISERVKTGMTGDMQTAAQDMITELLNLGPDGAAQVQLLKDMSAEQFAQVVTLWSQKGTDAVTEFTNKVESYRQPVIQVTADTSNAYQYLKGIQDQVNALNGTHVRIAVGAGGQGGITFGDGGYTGDGSRLQPAGIVHKGEVVIKASSAKKYGVANLLAINARGYAGGGLVGGGSSSSSQGSGGSSSPLIGTLEVHGYDPADAVRQFGHELSWAMKG